MINLEIRQRNLMIHLVQVIIKYIWRRSLQQEETLNLAAGQADIAI